MAAQEITPTSAEVVPRNTILEGDALAVLRGLPSRSVQCVITSPPYFGLRDYGADGQIGLESTLEGYLDKLVAVFDEVHRVLKPTGTCWVNIGDSYANDEKWGGVTGGKHAQGLHGETSIGREKRHTGFKPKDLMLVPFRLVVGLQQAGWWVRSDIVWAKPNPMPESVTDRPTRSHEYIFLLTRSERYYYDAAAIREPAKPGSRLTVPDGWAVGPGSHNVVEYSKRARTDKQRGHSRRHDGFNDRWDGMTKDEQQALGANKRDVWNVATEPYPDAHYATFPTALITPMVLAGSRPGDLVLDPFMGSGTVGVVAAQHGRDYLGIELSPQYAAMARQRIAEEGRPVVLKRKQRQEMRRGGLHQPSLLDVLGVNA